MGTRLVYALLLAVLVAASAWFPESTLAGPVESAAARPLAQGFDKSAPFGVSATLGDRVRDDEQEAAVALMREAGVQWAREEISWDKLQRTRGGPFLWGGDGSGFYNYDLSIERMRNAGINVLGLLAYNPAWFKSKNPTLDQWIDDWGNYVYNVVARYGAERGQIKHWEIWNEQNLRKYGYENTIYTVADYVKVLDVARAAAKAADPEAVIVLGGVASIWSDIPSPEDYDIPTYLRLLYEAGGWGSFDILAIHPYNPGAPEAILQRRDEFQDFEAELRGVDALLQEFGSKPVWITEMGWHSSRSAYGVSDEEQANFMVRMFLLAMAHPAVERVFWYDLRNDIATGSDYTRPTYNEREPQFHYGLVRRTYPLKADRNDLRKAAFAAFRTMTSLLEGMRFEGVLANGDNPNLPGTFAYRYSGGGRSSVALWRVGGGEPPSMTIDCSCKEARIRRWDGRLLGIVETYGPVKVRLDYIGTPIYIEWGTDRDGSGVLFPETGHRLAAPFAGYWNSNGGLSQFGYPLTGQLREADPATNKVRLVQYFERNRFEYFPENAGTPFEVQIGRLGDDVLRQQGIDWSTLPRFPDGPPECMYFAGTGHRLCSPFKEYWERNGGLALYGMPLTEPYEEDGQVVQYFERNRFEYFPENAGTPFEVQLGLLGREVYATDREWPSLR